HQLERPHNYHRRDVFIMAVIVNGKKVAGLGQPGKDGAPGKSAYQAAKEKGYTGTEEEFNTALAGMQSAPFLPLSGGTVEGVLEIRSGIEFGYGSNSIELSPSSASRLELVANASGGSSGGSIGGTVELMGLSAPTASNSAANKQYVDEHAGSRVILGSYVGTGAYGRDNPNSLTFPQPPKMVVCVQEFSDYAGGDNYGFTWVGNIGGTAQGTKIFSLSGNTLSWYNDSEAKQANQKGRTYYYTAIF
ncbi:hypothetical protein, partial [Flavonifractor plautii]|uniref:hypothetical protein n=1 Tax=Flavonifractor plautii TaxID=292800 RepID=UPI0024B8EC2A